MITRRELVATAAGFGLASAVGYIAVPEARGQAKPLKVKWDWLASNGQLGDIVALRNGYFEEVGFRVEFLPGGPNSATVPPVVSGQAQLGQFSSTNQAMNAASAGFPIKVFAAGYRTAPFAYFSLPRKPVRKPEDLVGKRLGTQPTARYATDALLRKHKIDPGKLEIVNMGFDMTPLVTGQLDVVTGWVTNTKALSVIGPDRIDFMIKDAGIINYGNAYFTSDEVIGRYPDIVVKFVKAVAKGWEWSFHNRAKAVDIMCDAYDTLDRAIEHKTVDVVMRLSFDQDTKEHGWGWFDPVRVQEALDLFGAVDFFKDKKKPALGSFITTQFVEATRDSRPRLAA
jgi:NitT/TauT family transport system substrate-binding protein